MSTIDIYKKVYEYSRSRTLETLTRVEKLPDPQAALRWRPAPGRAHAGWQLVHIAIAEDQFANMRLVAGQKARWGELASRFGRESVPDEDVPSVEAIREMLSTSRGDLFARLAEFSEERLEEIPPPVAERGWTVRFILGVLAWHEPHHQGQAHATLNMYEAQRR